MDFPGLLCFSSFLFFMGGTLAIMGVSLPFFFFFSSSIVFFHYLGYIYDHMSDV